jgi:hypothetical protein
MYQLTYNNILYLPHNVGMFTKVFLSNRPILRMDFSQALSFPSQSLVFLRNDKNHAGCKLSTGYHSTTSLHVKFNSLKESTRKILRRIYGPVQDKGQWRRKYNNELYDLFKEPKLSIITRIARLR